MCCHLEFHNDHRRVDAFTKELSQDPVGPEIAQNDTRKSYASLLCAPMRKSSMS